MNSHLLTRKAHITKIRMLLSSAEIFEASLTNSVDLDQTAPIGAVWQSDLGPHCLPLAL